MNRKPIDFALWAALPMAHTSQIEGRLTMILDSTRRRTVSRRTLVLGMALGAAALVPLAILKPASEAKTVSKTPEMPSDTSVQIIGVKDINIYHTDHRWWQADGSPLTGAEPHAALSLRFQKDLFSSSNVKNLIFAFHLPVIHFGETVKFTSTGSLTDLYQADARRSLWTLTSTFPRPQKTTTIQVGVAVHPWSIAAAHAPIHRGETSVPSACGNVIFSPIEHYPKNNWIVTVAADQPKRDQPKQDWRVVAVDAQGQQVYPVSTGSVDIGTRFRLMAYFNKSVSSRRIRLFRVETRPVVWTEFKDVALQPVKP